MTLRSINLVVVAILLAGCASSAPQPRAARRQGVETGQPVSVALVFTPPVTFGTEQDLDLDRAGRNVVAYGGYEDQVISETWVRQDDRYRQDRFGDQSQFERRAVSTTVTVRRQ